MAGRSVYRGAPGSTHTASVHYACPCGTLLAAEIHRSIDVQANPELRERLLATDPASRLNTVRCPGSADPAHPAAPAIIDVPVVYHDPGEALFVLILPGSHRHRELAARAELLLALDEDPAPVPPYVRDFAVVYEPAGLRGLLEERAQTRAAAAHAAEAAEALRRERERLDRDTAEMQRREAALAAQQEELAEKRQELAAKQEALAAEQEALAAEQEALAAEQEALAAQREHRERARTDLEEAPPRSAQLAPEDVTQEVALPGFRGNGHGLHTSPFSLFDGEDIEDGPAGDTTPGYADLTSMTAHVQDGAPTPDPVRDAEVARWIDSGDAYVMFVDRGGQVRACVTARGAEADMLLGPELEVRLELHRMAACPLIVLAMGTTASLAGHAGAPRPVTLHFDVEDAGDRQVLHVLCHAFAFTLEIHDAAYALRRSRRITAPLEENARHVLAVADSHLDSIAPPQRSFERALGAWANPDFDRHGWSHPERPEFREDKLVDLDSAQSVRRALAIASRFTNPRRQDYLFLVRGYPMRLWREQRRAVLVRAIELGIWPGARLAPVAVEEGLARSRGDLVQRLRDSFQALQRHASADNDLDADAASDNWTALEAEAAALGPDGTGTGQLEPRRRVPRSTPIASGDEPVVSGTIDEVTRAGVAARATRNLPGDELIARLGDEALRVDAAIELARRRETRAIDAVMASLADMNRADAVRVCGALPGFGAEITGALIAGLSSHMGFVRQGSALALAVLGTEDAIEALARSLIDEPAAIWKEIARGFGVVGPAAVLPLVSRLAQATPAARERVTWALAHIHARGGQAQVEQLAAGRDPVAAHVARSALELASLAHADDQEVRGREAPREQTVNRAFSRTFFQFLESASPVISASASFPAVESSAAGMLLDEADLLESVEDEEEVAELLDESDLIPT